MQRQVPREINDNPKIKLKFIFEYLIEAIKKDKS